ncbi:GAF domain-containing protein [Bacillus sp. DNRA2]|uniref:helix-turn-helix domain-containing protein n=1 Tax=Bacillus sp. DNRA2 TaxID=2723053 RepID=UPI00145E4B19|nr:helix-turn-helix domain-containing protein [Bacillus sp. DNRA2]NMD69234.1 GAF domain-containing protein [Bacillus sp. DNRA2]
MQDTLTHRQLKSLIHVSNVINSSFDIDIIIDSIMIETISVVEAAGGGSFWLYNKEENCLVAQSAQGNFYPHIFRQIRLKPGESLTGTTFAAGKGLHYPNEEVIKKALTTLRPHNRGLLDQSIANNFHFTSVISSPIILKGECIGVITLDSFQDSLTFKQEDIKLLEAIAHQAAIALDKSSLYHEKEKTVQMLTNSINIHTSLANLVLNGEGLQSILSYIQQTIGEPTFLFDDLGELIASAYDHSLSTDTINYIKLQAIQFILSLENSRSVTEIEIYGESYQLVALSLGSKPKSLGILLILSKQRMSQLDIAALEHACTVISLELVKEQAIFDTQQRLRGDFVSKLLSGQMDETLLQRAKNLNLDPKRNYVTLMINFGDSNKLKINRENMMRNLLHYANQIFLQYNPQGMAVPIDQQIVVLLSFDSKMSASSINSQLKALAKSYLKEIQVKYDLEGSIGIGRVKSGLIYGHQSFKDATKCINFIEKYHFDDNVLCYTDLGVQRFILQNSEEELVDFTHEVLGSLIEYEKSRKAELLQTLFVYFDQNQNIKKTADTLHIHPNTLNYRLKRIEEILSVELIDNKQIFNIHLAINIYQYVKDRPSFQLQNS